MPIEVQNHLWVAVCGSSFVHQFEEYRTRRTEPPDQKNCERMMEEAMAVADTALEAHTKVVDIYPARLRVADPPAKEEQ